jgi:hypothetical protein
MTLRENVALVEHLILGAGVLALVVLLACGVAALAANVKR